MGAGLTDSVIRFGFLVEWGDAREGGCLDVKRVCRAGSFGCGYFIHRVFFSFGGEDIVWTGMFASRMSRLIMCGRRLLILRMMRGIC